MLNQIKLAWLVNDERVKLPERHKNQEVIYQCNWKSKHSAFRTVLIKEIKTEVNDLNQVYSHV